MPESHRARSKDTRVWPSRRNLHRQVTEALPLGLAVLQLEEPTDPGSLRVLYANPVAARLAAPSFPLGQLVGKTLREACPEILQTDRPSKYAEVAATGRAQDLGEIRGGERAYRVQAFPVSRRVVGILFQEMRHHRSAQDRLERRGWQREQAERLAHMGSWRWDVRSDEVTWSGQLYRIYGLAPETFAGTVAAYLERVHPDDRAVVESTVRQALETGQPFRIKERIVRPSGEVRVLHSYGDVVRDESGATVAMFGLCRDVTDIELAEEAVREAERRFTQAVHASPGAICIKTEPEGRILDVNQRFLDLLGYRSRDDVVGKHGTDVGLWAATGERAQFLDGFRQGQSIREVPVTFRTRTGQIVRTLAAVERTTVGGQDSAMLLFWRP